MRKHNAVLLGIGISLAISAIAIPAFLVPRHSTTDMQPAAAIDPTEQAKTISDLRPPKRTRPVIAVVSRNDGTEVTDFLVANSVLRRADVADVVIVAERAEPVRLYPSLKVDPDSTMPAFDQRYPEGADYVVVPAMDPGNDPVIAAWISAQHRKGTTIISICNGSRVLSTAGLLDGRRATAHWSAVEELRKKHPTMRWVPDRRYVFDNGVSTSTGITASIPAMLALVEAIGGHQVAGRVAAELGIANWDARHTSSLFELTSEHKKTFIRNNLALWRHETIGIPVVDGVDEIALSMTVDAYARTELADVVTVSREAAPVRSKYGLMIHADQTIGTADLDHILGAPNPDTPALTLERELPRIAARYDAPTAAIVRLVMEYSPLAASEATTR